MKTLLVAGGSGGHLIPALTLAQHLVGEDSCFLLSTSQPVDRIMAGVASVEWKEISLERFTPVWRWLQPRYAIRQWSAVREVWRLMREIQPEVVVGFGGYLSAVGVTAARLAGLPTVIHEQNLIPGKANRLLARWADAVAVSFPETKRFLPPRASVEVTGNPVRPNFGKVPSQQARAFFGFDPDRPVLLIMGGSQGTRAINEAALSMWRGRPPEERQKIQVLHLAGMTQALRLEEEYRRMGMSARVFAFLHEIHLAMAAATLVICRAGATTLSELVVSGIPAILIPYPHAGGHQTANARWMQAAGASVVLEQKGLTPELLWERVRALLTDADGLSGMRAALAAKKNGSAVERLSTLVRNVADSAVRPELVEGRSGHGSTGSP